MNMTKASISENMSPWDRVQIARNPQRPRTLDYIQGLCEDFVELHGDRRFGDDEAIVGGIAVFEEQTVVIVGHQKGRDTRENVRRHFGMPHPEVIGEGGSGGALAIGVADRLLMLENSVYSVASPEASASILWRDSARAPDAASAMRITALDLQDLGIADEVIPEPGTGAHTARNVAVSTVRERLRANLAELQALDTATLLERRYAKYRSIGRYHEQAQHIFEDLLKEATGMQQS